MAGAISQRYDPVANYDPAAKGTFEVPTLLRQAAEVVPPSRDLTFFISHLGAAEQARALGAPREYLGCGQGASVDNGFDYPLDVASNAPQSAWQ